MLEPDEARTTDKLAEAHARFATASLWIYFGASLVALALFVAAVVTDKIHADERTEQHLSLETEVLAHRIGDHLALLVEELQRLGLRSEVNLLDQNLEPERGLLDMAHQDSPLFNLGVAIVNAEGNLIWGQPESFAPDARLGSQPSFLDVRDRRTARVIPPRSGKAILYVLSPIVREGRFTGALVGGINLSEERFLADAFKARPGVTTVLASARGGIVYPETPLPFTKTANWFSLFQHREAKLVETDFDAVPSVAAIAPIVPGDLYLVNAIRQSDLFGESDRRLRTRLLFGVFLALSPMVALVWFLRRSLSQFQRAETAAVREDRLRTIGEAANVIAHEVRNSLNGIRMGFDLMLDKQHRPSERVVTELRAEIERLTTFAYQLMLFAKNPEPRRQTVDLSEMMPKWLSLTRDVAAETGVSVELAGAEAPLRVVGDPMLLQIVASNLVSNALDAVASANPPRIVVSLASRDGQAEVRVADNGSGIRPELRKRLFEPFVSGKPSGVGMGLSISRKIAIAHDGDLVLEQGEPGASFLFTLPLAET